MTSIHTHSALNFQRSHFTWLAYGMLGFYAYLQSSLGPVMPFLRQELELSFTLGGLHASAFAVGMIISGFWGDRVADRYGARAAFWAGGAGMGAGTLLLITGSAVAVTITAAFVMGLLGSLLLVTIQATLSDEHGEGRSVALMEANLVASLCASLVAVLVGAFVAVGVGWRAALIVVVILWAVSALAQYRQRFPAPVSAGDTCIVSDKRLPRRFWLYWLVTFIGVSVEWCMVLWSADFLITAHGFEPAGASASVAIFMLAAVLARFISSRLLRIVEAGPMLLVSQVFILVGFPLFWLGTVPALNLIGLFIVGFGVANIFPLGVGVSTTTAPQLSSKASARILLAAGVAILVNPQLLGMVADVTGIERAFGIVIILTALGIGATLSANRLKKQRS